MTANRNLESQTQGWALYDSTGTIFCGTVKVTEPSVEVSSQSVSGAGIAGSVTVPTDGNVQDMKMSVEFLSSNGDSIRIMAPGWNLYELRLIEGNHDPATTGTGIRKTKINVKAAFLSASGGDIQNGSLTGCTVSLSVSDYKKTVDGTEVLNIAPAGYGYTINGVDYLAEHKKFLGI